MPYTKPEERIKYKEIIDNAVKVLSENGAKSGDINYLISSIVTRLFKKEMKYDNANKLIGVLECLKIELYNRHIFDYETIKMNENGPIV